MTSTPRMGPIALAARLLVAAGLGLDAYVHLHLAAGYQITEPAGIGQGNLFRIEAGVAVLVGLLVLVTGHRLAFLAAFLVGLSALAAVLLYRYVDVPAFGPIPSMYEPVWFYEKVLSAVGEGVAALAALSELLRQRRVLEPIGAY